MLAKVITPREPCELTLNTSMPKSWEIYMGLELTYSIGNELSRPAGHRALLDNNSTLPGVLRNNGSDGLESRHVGCASSANTTVLCRGINSNKDHVGLANALGHIRGKEKIGGPAGHRDVTLLGRGQLALRSTLVGEGEIARTIASDTDNVVQARLVYGRVARVPAANTKLISINNRHLNVRVLEGNNSSGGTT